MAAVLLHQIKDGIRVLRRWRLDHWFGQPFWSRRVCIILCRGEAFELEQQIVLIRSERQPVLHRYLLFLDHRANYRVKILHPVDLAVADRVQ